jgi:hypothetical protein
MKTSCFCNEKYVTAFVDHFNIVSLRDGFKPETRKKIRETSCFSEKIKKLGETNLTTQKRRDIVLP